MNVTVELDGDCPPHWVPERADMERWLNAAGALLAPPCGDCSVGIRVVDEADGAALNRQYRGQDYPTNVLSFASALPPAISELLEPRPLGDIAICAPVLEKEAASQGKQLAAHWAHLLTHGFLHLNGYDHATQTQAARMEALEKAALEQLGFADPYLVD